MKILRVVASALITVTVLAAVAAFAFFGIGPRTGRYQTVTVLTGSMRGTYDPGDVVVVTPHPRSSVRVGDVITFHAPIEGNPIFTHRVIEVLEPGPNPVVRTKGDASSAADLWRARLDSGPVWKAAFGIPKAGYAINRLRQPAVRQALVAVVPLVLAFVWVAQIWSGDGAAEDDVEPATAPLTPDVPRTAPRSAFAMALRRPWDLLRRPPGQHWAV